MKRLLLIVVVLLFLGACAPDRAAAQYVYCPYYGWQPAHAPAPAAVYARGWYGPYGYGWRYQRAPLFASPYYIPRGAWGYW